MRRILSVIFNIAIWPIKAIVALVVWFVLGGSK